MLGSLRAQMIMLDYPGPDEASIKGQWKALEEMASAKQTRTLAVSNFSPRQLDVIIKSGGTVPTCNQVRCPPRPSIGHLPIQPVCVACSLARIVCAVAVWRRLC